MLTQPEAKKKISRRKAFHLRGSKFETTVTWMGTHKNMPDLGFDMYHWIALSWSPDSRTTPRQGICFQPQNTDLRTVVFSGSVRDVILLSTAIQALWLWQYQGFSERGEDNPVIFVLLATLGPFKRKGEERHLCTVLLDIVLRAQLYCLPPWWSYCAVQMGGLAATAWLIQMFYHVYWYC